MTSKSCLFRTALAGALAITVSAASSVGAAIVYNVDQTIGAGSVVGTITTDGGTGVLAASDITAWNLELTGVGASYDLKNTDSDSAVVVIGGDLTATTHDLYFNFGGTAGDYFLLQDNLYSGQTYYCNSIW